MGVIARVPPGGRKELGRVNWLIARNAAGKIQGGGEMHLFTVLGQHRWLFRAFWLYSGQLLGRGKLSLSDKELVVLRVAHLRDSKYELQLGRKRGVDNALQERTFAGPDAEGLTDRQRALLQAVDEFVTQRDMSDDAFAHLASYLNHQQIIEFCCLAAHYDGIAAVLATLRVPLDYPEGP
jgi:alkylhydroperoxidase family enzyme